MKRKAERTKSLNCGNGGIRDSGQNKRASVSEHEGPPSCVWLALPASFAGGPYDGSGVSLSATPSTAKKLKKKKSSVITRPPSTTKNNTRHGRVVCRRMPAPALIQLLTEHAAMVNTEPCVFIIISKALALDLKNKWLGFCSFPAVFLAPCTLR